jgi:hypothetical protein
MADINENKACEPTFDILGVTKTQLRKLDALLDTVDDDADGGLDELFYDLQETVESFDEQRYTVELQKDGYGAGDALSNGVLTLVENL